MIAPLKLLRTDRAAVPGLALGTPLYHGNDCYGLANDDSRMTGIEHISVSINPSGYAFFTVPREDVERVQE